MAKQAFLWLVLAVLSSVLLAACGAGEQAASTSGLADKGAEFVTLLAEGKFDEATTWLDPTMAAAMPPSKLKEAWGSLSRLGEYQGQASARTAKEQGFDVVYVTCNFERGPVDVKVVFGPQGKVGGLWFVPPQTG